MRKIVTLKRKPNNTNLPDHVYDGAQQGIGATYNAVGKVNKGITMDEINSIMPDILHIPNSDNSFLKAVEEFFFNMSINVPAAGTDLNIALDEKTHKPVEPMDYVRYKFALAHPYVLGNPKDQQERAKKRKYKWIVEDATREKALKIAAKNKRKEAVKAYVKLTDSKTKMDQVLRVLGLYTPALDQDDKEMLLEKEANDNPKQFLDVVNNKSLDTISFIRECLTHEVLRKVGNSILNGEEVLGSDEEEAVLYLQDKKNSETMVTLKAKLGEFKKQ